MSNSPRYGTNTTNTSKYMTDLMNEFIKMPKGVFNNTSRKNLDIPIGAIVPFDVWEMLPNSDAYLKYDLQLISKNPTVKRLLSAMNAEIRVYKCNYNDCWEGWNNFITKGRSGKVSLSIPYLDWSLNAEGVTTCLPYNPASLLNLAPPVFLGDDTDGHKYTIDFNRFAHRITETQASGQTGITTNSGLLSSTAMRINALPFVFYNKICKKYQNPNLLQENPHWYPENENHDQILPYSTTGAVTTSDYDNPKISLVDDGGYWRAQQPKLEKVGDEYRSYPWLNILQSAQRKGDYFNTGSPFPDLIRGDIPTLSLLTSEIDWTGAIAGNNKYINGFMGLTSDGKMAAVFPSAVQSEATETSLTFQNDENIGFNLFERDITNDLEGNGTFNGYQAQKLSNTSDQTKLKNVLSQAVLKGLEFSMRQWRYLATMTIMKERLALTDGSYNAMIKSMFGHNPRWHSHDCQYVGGSKQQIVFSEVVNQTASSYAPLGDTAGRAVSSQENNVIHVHSDDFGMFMAVIVIQPDEYYSQGVDKMFSRLENAQQYFPILNNLSPDATLNKELYVSGNNSVDEDVFNYQERFAYYKSRRNQVSGLMQIAISKIGDIGAYIWNRLFGSTPNFNHEFNMLSPTGNEKAIFASTNQAEFCAVIGRNFRYIAPIPEDSRPSDMGISY